MEVTSNIEWCEAVTHAHAYSPLIAEFFNTWSNIVFIIVGFIGLRRSLMKQPSIQHVPTISKQNLLAHIFTDMMIVIVGLGSMWFHSQRSYLGEILDELPMSIMAFGYMLCLDHLHWLTKTPYRNTTYLCMFLILLIGWLCYIIWDAHEIFTTLFTIQILVPIFISCASCIAGSSRSLWIACLVAILSGKIIWEFERYLHENKQCPMSQSHPLFWCHPMWHLLSALSHYFWIKYISEIPLRAEKKNRHIE
jgi:hypothetical protein